MSDKIKAR